MVAASATLSWSWTWRCRQNKTWSGVHVRSRDGHFAGAGVVSSWMLRSEKSKQSTWGWHGLRRRVLTCCEMPVRLFRMHACCGVGLPMISPESGRKGQKKLRLRPPAAGLAMPGHTRWSHTVCRSTKVRVRVRVGVAPDESVVHLLYAVLCRPMRGVYALNQV